MKTKLHHILHSGLFSMMVLFFLFSFQKTSGQTTETFNASTTWQAPAGVTSVTVECWGAGGAGGGGSDHG